MWKMLKLRDKLNYKVIPEELQSHLYVSHVVIRTDDNYDVDDDDYKVDND